MGGILLPNFQAVQQSQLLITIL